MLRIAIFYIDAHEGTTECVLKYDLSEALIEVQRLRNLGNGHVCYSTMNTDMVGSYGVSSVENGMLPNGDSYGWTKRRVS